MFINLQVLCAHKDWWYGGTVVYKNLKNSDSSIQKLWKLLAWYFPWYVYGYSTSFNFSINGFGHIRHANSINFFFFLLAWSLCIMFSNTKIYCAPLQYGVVIWTAI